MVSTVGVVGVAPLLLISALVFGGSTAVGVPMPADPGLQGVAPAECLLYAAHRGLAKADPNSTNDLERLLAEPQVQALVDELMRLADEGIRRAPVRQPAEKLLVDTAPLFVKTLVARPSVFYVGSVSLPPEQPTGKAALVLHAGDQAAAIQDALKEWESFYLTQVPPNQTVETSTVEGAELRRLPLPPGVPPIAWGVRGEYVFFALGDGEAEAVAKRLAKPEPPPAWLTDVEKQMAIPRLGGMIYFNFAKAYSQASPLLDIVPGNALPFDPKQLVRELGLDRLQHLALGSGLDATTSVGKFQWIEKPADANDKPAANVVKPITKEELTFIPAGVDLAWIGRFDPAQTFDQVLGVVEKMNAEAAGEFRRGLTQAEDQLGFSLRNDLLGGLGDTWALYNSADEGGYLLTGATVVGTVRDRAKVEKAIDQILRFASAQARRGGDDAEPFAVRHFEVGDVRVNYLQVLAAPLPFAPAWCISGDRLIVSSSPQMVRSHLLRPADAKSLAENERIAKLLSTGDVTSLSYSDPRGVAKVLYSYMLYGATMAASALEKETGLRADLSKLPSFSAIYPHIQPSIGVTRRLPNGWSLESHGVVPSLSLPTATGAVGAMMGLLVPQVQLARETARGNTSRSNLRMLSIAAFSYEARSGRPLPRTICNADGKPLLSWRVAILPDIDQQSLYDQFHRDEPWDSEHNKALLDKMPDIYRHPSASTNDRSGTTQYQIPRGKGTLYDGNDAPTNKDVDRLNVGRDQIVLFVEATSDRAVPWTKPDDVELTPNVFERLFRSPGGSVNVSTAGGAVFAVSPDEAPQNVSTMFFPRLAK